MVSHWFTNWATLLGLILLQNARITNGRWKGEVNTVAQLSRINGPLGRISERTDGADLVSLGGHHNNARISRRQRDLSVVKVGSNNNSDVDMFHKKCLTNSSSSLGLKDLSSIHVKCNGLVNLSISLQQIPPNLVEKVTSIQITNSMVLTLELNQFQRFPSLENLSVTHSNISIITGSFPYTLKTLNLSHNNIKSMESAVFHQKRSGGMKKNKIPLNKNAEPPFLVSSYEDKDGERHDDESNSFSQKSTFNQQTPTTSSYYSTKSRTKFPHNNNNYNEDNNRRESESELSPPLDEHGGMGRVGESNVDLNGSGSVGSNSPDTNDFRTLSRLQEIDLSHNKISELPKSIFYLENLQSLLLSGNQLKCEFVWEKLWEWSEMKTSNKILTDADETFCGVVDDVRVFHYSINHLFQARKDLEETCSSVDKALCHDCSLYALQREGHPNTSPITHSSSENKNKDENGKSPPNSSNGSGARISISLKLDCSSNNLTEIPHVPQSTWQLNISNNLIKDLSNLKLPMYENLLILDGNSNQVNLETLAGTPFIEKYNYLNLQNNGFTTIPTSILNSLKSSSGQGVTFFGQNYINCDCDLVKEIKPLLIENSNKIKDLKDIFCKDVKITDGNGFTRVKDLLYSDVCHIDSLDSDFASELYLYLIIFGEALLILLIIGKVWHDQRTFRRTGILPWCSAKMPRLPCDFMLESVKEPPTLNNFTRHSGSATSSNINVNNQSSISHIQLKDIRSSGSGGGGSVYSNSDKSSRSAQQQLSSYPSTSSRTSSV